MCISDPAFSNNPADDLTDAERQMIELLRHDCHFTLAISQDGGQWHVRLEDHDTGTIGDGHGPSFDIAWDDVVDPRLRHEGATS